MGVKRLNSGDARRTCFYCHTLPINASPLSWSFENHQVGVYWSEVLNQGNMVTAYFIVYVFLSGYLIRYIYMSICVLETLIIIIIIIIIIISKIRENGDKINRLPLGLRPCLWIQGVTYMKAFLFLKPNTF